MFPSTLRRVAAYGGLATAAARLRLSRSEHASRQAHQLLCDRLGRLRGLPQKLGQMWSFRNTDEAAESASLYAPLQENADPLPWREIEPVLLAAWGEPLSRLVTEIDHHGLAASLGQVHKARLRDGRAVSVKVQYPGIRQAVDTDLGALGWLAIPLGTPSRGFDLNTWKEAIRRDLDQELDYRQEAQEQQAFAAEWAEDADIVVPRVINSLSDERVLVTTWEEGEHWDAVRSDWPTADRRQLAATLARFFLRGLFRHGRMQADWHPGNLRFRRGGVRPQIVIYDFGCVCRPSPGERLALVRLIRATITQAESPWPLLLALGFNARLLEPISAKLPAVCRLLFEPFCESRPYDIADWRLAERMASVLGDDRWNFRLAGPPRLFGVLRAFHGLIHYLRGLAVPLDWHSLFFAAISGLTVELDTLALPATASRPGFDQLATWLKIRVRENGITKVQLTQAASAIERLEDLLDDDLRRNIAEQQIQLDEIVAGVRQRAYAPGPVFEWNQGGKQIMVWME
ncbi:MAG: AarF/ABC1/UbiB kinase family protein [Pirellulales bacterium]|nr:AarF/ABC1/UbiB kinase family protein [Pirellulales bacterium]